MELVQTEEWKLTVDVINEEDLEYRLFTLHDLVTGEDFKINNFAMEEVIGVLQAGLGITKQYDNDYIKRNNKQSLTQEIS
jgi:hypothetical protein